MAINLKLIKCYCGEMDVCDCDPPPPKPTLYTDKEKVNFFNNMLINLHTFRWTGDGEKVNRVLDAIGGYSYTHTNSNIGDDDDKYDRAYERLVSSINEIVNSPASWKKSKKNNMNTIDKQYQALLQDILDNGCIKKDRTGTGTISVFGRQIRHRMSDGFPLITTKKMAWKTMVTELLWFLRGDTNIKYLVDNGCHIWDGDTYQAYLKENLDKSDVSEKDPDYILLSKEEFIDRIKTDEEFAKKWGELGPIYGKQWRNWNGKEEQVTNYLGGEINPYFCDCQERFEDGHSKVRKKNQGIDQIADVIHKLKTNPDDRGIIVSAWNVGELDQMVLRPCHNFFQFYTRELNLEERMKLAGYEDVSGIGQNIIREQVELDNTIPRRAISLMWNQRSCDVPLGIPMNIASYGLLLMMIAKQVNMIPEELIGNFGDAHIYLNQVEGIKKQLTREPYELPTVKISDRVVNDISEYIMDDIILENYQSHPTIKLPLSN